MPGEISADLRDDERKAIDSLKDSAEAYERENSRLRRTAAEIETALLEYLADAEWQPSRSLIERIRRDVARMYRELGQYETCLSYLKQYVDGLRTTPGLDSSAIERLVRAHVEQPIYDVTFRDRLVSDVLALQAHGEKMRMSTFTLDAYKGWTYDQLKRRCLELVHITMHKDVVIAVLAKHGIENLNETDRKEVERICSQWDD